MQKNHFVIVYGSFISNLIYKSNPSDINIIDSTLIQTIDFHQTQLLCKDIDILITINQYKSLFGSSPQSRYCMKVINDVTYDITIVDVDDNNDDQLLKIYHHQNNIAKQSSLIINVGNTDDKYMKLGNFNMIQCSVLMHYTIIKSHIHRVINKDIDKWFKHLKIYNHIRSNYNYSILDNIIYNVDNISSSTMSTYHIYHDVFINRFNWINDKIGDCVNTFLKNKDEFFNDAVERFIPHDDLHIIVNPNPLYKNFLANENDVMMDEKLFKNASMDVKIKVIIEEITVLYIERYLLPILSRNNSVINNLEYLHKNFNACIAHFVTNLCGNSHSWLRNWCLDHFMLFSNYDIYHTKSINIAKKILKISDDKLIDNLNNTNIVTLTDTQTYINKFLVNNDIYNGHTDENIQSVIIESLNLYKFHNIQKKIIKTYDDDHNVSCSKFIDIYERLCCDKKYDHHHVAKMSINKYHETKTNHITFENCVILDCIKKNIITVDVASLKTKFPSYIFENVKQSIIIKMNDNYIVMCDHPVVIFYDDSDKSEYYITGCDLYWRWNLSNMGDVYIDQNYFKTTQIIVNDHSTLDMFNDKINQLTDSNVVDNKYPSMYVKIYHSSLECNAQDWNGEDILYNYSNESFFDMIKFLNNFLSNFLEVFREEQSEYLTDKLSGYDY
jgi:hypothetical protein